MARKSNTRLEWPGTSSCEQIPPRTEIDLSRDRAFRLLLHHPAVRALLDACEGTGEVAIWSAACCATAPSGCRATTSTRSWPAARVDGAIAERLAAALPARLVLLGGKEFAAYRLVAGESDGRPLGPRRGRPSTPTSRGATSPSTPSRSIRGAAR